MTQEDKKLLYKDLSTRLPYRPFICFAEKVTMPLLDVFADTESNELMSLNGLDFGYIKPYLRSMSTMTEDEKTQVQRFIDIVTDENYGDGYSPSAWDAMNGFVQYCDSHHLDHRGLIFRGLALEAPEGMYNFK